MSIVYGRSDGRDGQGPREVRHKYEGDIRESGNTMFSSQGRARGSVHGDVKTQSRLGSRCGSWVSQPTTSK